jgi:putative transposase
MTRYIDQNRASYMVEPICRTLEIAPSSYYAARSRPPSARTVSDAQLKGKISAVHRENFAVYGVRKVWRVLHRQGEKVGRDRVARLMGTLGLVGVTRERSIRTTRPADLAARPADLVERTFAAPAPNRLWVADLTYVWTIAGFCYTAFIVDVFSRRIVGWRVAASLRTDLALDALEMAIFARGHFLPDLIHHSDRGVQGEFLRSSQHLPSEELRWDTPKVSALSGRLALGCDLPAIHRAGVASTSSGSGRQSHADCPARMPQSRPAFHPRSGTGGSGKVVACEQSAPPIYQAATSPSRGERRSPFCELRAAAFAT